LAAAFLLELYLLPPRHAQLSVPSWQSSRRTVAGAMHLHTNRSDGSGTPQEVAEAAGRAGLAFVVLTDHGDATRQPDPPQYRSSVLCIDAVEISTNQGHYVALGLPQQIPYRLAGEPRDVVEDVTRLGGFGIVAHPDSRKPGLQWHEWAAPFDGIEWLNADSEWRDEGKGPLVRALLTYPFRPVETIGALFDRPDRTLSRWDEVTQHRRVVGVAGTDAHARLGAQNDDTNEYRGWSVRLPSYEASLRSFALRVSLDTPLSGNAASDAAQLISAIRRGHLFTAIDAVASPAAFEFSAKTDQSSAEEGDLIEPHGPIEFTARVNRTTGGVIALRKDGKLLTQHPVPDLKFETSGGRGVYRVEVYLSKSPGESPVPWIVSNPIFVEAPGWGTPPVSLAAPAIDSWAIQGGPWHVEQASGSSGAFTAHGPPKGSVEFGFRLAGGSRAGQYAALVISVGNALTGHNRLAFHAAASAPMRVSVQARRPAGQRWQRSVYLDQTARDFVIPFGEMTPVESNFSARFVPSDIDTLLFVVDTTNTVPGTAGRFTLGDLRVEH
jgi:hypothetical protein